MGYTGIQVSPIETIGRAEIEAEHRRRRALQIKAMITDFDRRADHLEREIIAEQDRTGIHDTGHYAYPTYARAAIVRRDNLRRSADELRAELQRSGLNSSEPVDRISNARSRGSLRGGESYLRSTTPVTP